MSKYLKIIYSELCIPKYIIFYNIQLKVYRMYCGIYKYETCFFIF